MKDVRRVTGIKKSGHAGTLDPMATGALVIGLGPVTRLIRFIQDQPKEYLATAQFGVETETLDADGAILDRVPMEVSFEDVSSAAIRFVGTIHQVPPMYSALKHQGRRLYDIAFAGETVEREARPVVIHELEIQSVGTGPYPEVEFRVVCGKGTYVRSLAHDLAMALGGPAHLTALRRFRIGSLSLAEHGIDLGRLEEWEGSLLAASDALIDLPAVVVDASAVDGVRNGTPFVGETMRETPEDVPFRVIDATGSLLAVYRRHGDRARPEVVIPA